MKKKYKIKKRVIVKLIVFLVLVVALGVVMLLEKTIIKRKNDVIDRYYPETAVSKIKEN